MPVGALRDSPKVHPNCNEEPAVRKALTAATN
jgi:hypothetical protein